MGSLWHNRVCSLSRWSSAIGNLTSTPAPAKIMAALFSYFTWPSLERGSWKIIFAIHLTHIWHNVLRFFHILTHIRILLWGGICFIHSLLVRSWADGHVVLLSVFNVTVSSLKSTSPVGFNLQSPWYHCSSFLVYCLVYVFLFFSFLLVWA